MNSTSKKTILLVEDEIILAMLTSHNLEKLGYEVITADSGENALSTIFNRNNIDLVLMDIDLGPGIDGSETARQITEKMDIPIVFYSSHSEEYFINKIKEITRYGYVVKGSDNFVFREALQMAFELHNAYTLALNNAAKLEATLNALPDKIFELGLDGYCFDYHEPNYDSSSEFSKNMTGKYIQQIYPQSASEIILSSLTITEQFGFCLGKQIMLINDNNQSCWYELSVTRKKGKFTEPHYILVKRNITEQKILDEELEISHRKYFDLFESAPLAYFIINDSGIITELNYSASEILDLPKQFVLKANFNKFVHREDRDVFLLFLGKLSKTNATQNCRLNIFIKNGTTTEVLLTGAKLNNSANPALFQIAAIKTSLIESSLKNCICALV